MGTATPGQAELARRAEEVLRELARLIDDGGPRTDHLFGEGADRVPQKLLLLGQVEIHATPEYIGQRAGGRTAGRQDES